MKSVKAVAVHTYLGGMQLGVAETCDVETSLESWEDAIEARLRASERLAASKMDFVPPWDDLKTWSGKADLVFANPPCARFSVTSARHYSAVKKTDLGEFCELQDVCGIAQSSGASMMWWETGPMLWTKGRDMVESIHRYMERWWGSCTTLLVKVDARTFGIPQKRSRVHAIHCEGRFVPTVNQLADMWPIKLTAHEWVVDQMTRRWKPQSKWLLPTNPSMLDTKPRDDWGDPIKYCQVQDLTCTFGQGKPQQFSVKDPFLPVVLSGRLGCWSELKRWISIEEWSAFMTIPPTYARAVADEIGSLKTLQLLSKGVCSDVSKGVSESFALPMLSRSGDTSLTADDMWNEDCYEVDVSVFDRRKRRFRQGHQV